jgi:UDP-glucuronate 4-epimerase
MRILLTGIAGFIGYHVAKKLIDEDHEVYSVDNINDYYDTQLKYDRLKDLGFNKEEIDQNTATTSKRNKNLYFQKLDLKEKEDLFGFCQDKQIEVIIHLAAQAGVRYSLTNPYAYMDSNIHGFINILELARAQKVKHLVYASSSSVYGLNEIMPFSVHHNVDHPISLYAASKKSNELMAHSYSHLYHIPTTGLRFFTVYGPWGRPDMAYFIFTKAILEGKPIEIYNNGNMQRDFTYIDDIVEGIVRVAQNVPSGNPEWSGKNPDPGSSKSPYRIYNIGNNSPVKLMDFIKAIEKSTGKEAIKEYKPIQPGDVLATYADVTDLMNDIGYKPSTGIQEGVNRFVEWYREYYKV